MKNSTKDTITASISVNFKFEAPLQENTQIGIMQVNLEGKNIFNIEIMNRNTILKKDISYYIKTFLKNYCSYF